MAKDDTYCQSVDATDFTTDPDANTKMNASKTVIAVIKEGV